MLSCTERLSAAQWLGAFECIVVGVCELLASVPRIRIDAPVMAAEHNKSGIGDYQRKVRMAAEITVVERISIIQRPSVSCSISTVKVMAENIQRDALKTQARENARLRSGRE